jgi:hypothetical protein
VWIRIMRVDGVVGRFATTFSHVVSIIASGPVTRDFVEAAMFQSNHVAFVEKWKSWYRALNETMNRKVTWRTKPGWVHSTVGMNVEDLTTVTTRIISAKVPAMCKMLNPHIARIRRMSLPIVHAAKLLWRLSWTPLVRLAPLLFHIARRNVKSYSLVGICAKTCATKESVTRVFRQQRLIVDVDGRHPVHSVIKA